MTSSETSKLGYFWLFLLSQPFLAHELNSGACWNPNFLVENVANSNGYESESTSTVVICQGVFKNQKKSEKGKPVNWICFLMFPPKIQKTNYIF